MNNFIINAQNVLTLEANAIKQLISRIDDNFVQACKLIQNCSGKVVVIGMGKSGHIGRKIAATLASTGTPSFFIHPGEAGHGDLGMVEKNDVIIYISYSGAAIEITSIMPIIKRTGNKTIAITGNRDAEISINADVWLDGSVEQEACPYNLAPTSSTTVALALGDSLAMAVLQEKGFSPDDFARSHPSGVLGKRLLTSVSDIMHSGNNVPIIKENQLLVSSLVVMSEKKMGLLIIVDKHNELLGIFTDGDLRRVVEAGDIHKNIYDVITTNPKTIDSNKPAVAALAIMEEFNINSLVVVDDNRVVGAINMHSLMQAKII